MTKFDDRQVIVNVSLAPDAEHNKVLNKCSCVLQWM